MSLAPHTAAPRTAVTRGRLSLLIGLALTGLVVAADAAGYLATLERHMLDWRYQWFAQFNPPPSARIVHVDIDDNALKNIGRWPWPRGRLARVIDELHNAGAAVIGFDLLFDEPQPPRWTPDPDASKQTPEQFRRIDDDAALAEALRRSASSILAVNLINNPPPGPVTRRALAELLHAPRASAAELAERLALNATEARWIDRHIAGLKTIVFRDRLFELLDAPDPPDFEACRGAILPDLPAHVTDAPELALLRQEYDRGRATLHVSRDLPDAGGEGRTDKMSRYRDDLTVPIPRLAKAAAGVGSVAYEPAPDGRVRTVPLWLTYRDHHYPHFALALACAYLEVPVDALRIEPGATIMPDATFPNGEKRSVRLPTTQARPGDGWRRFTDRRLMIPWQTNAEHWSMLFAAHGGAGAQHVPIGRIVELRRLRDDVAHNREQADLVLLNLMTDPALAMAFPGQLVESYHALSAKLHGPDAAPADEALLARRDELQAQVFEVTGFLREQLGGAAELTGAERRMLDKVNTALGARADALEQADEGEKKIAAFQSELRSLVSGSVCIIGWTATGSLADFVPTSLESKCPGPVVHGAILSGILTGHFIERGPVWLNLLLVVLVGLVTTWIAARFAPVSAMVITGGFVVLYFLVNGMVLFDLYDTQVAAASPITGAALAWVGVTVFRLVAEQREKMRITRQFRNYVSPDLVDSLVGNPALIKSGRHELTCLFTDIAGFTSVSEKLPVEQTIGLLNRYLAALTDRAMDGRGYVNKYLGDGLMAVWGAPLENPRHALDCCASAIACMDALRELNNAPDLQELPNLHMRVGIATGPMMVGDCGAPPRRSDYTVIGDTVNLASRLEAANKQFGTRILINHRTWELVQEHMLARPIGRIVVVGRSEPEPVYELLSDLASATDEQRDLAAATARAVEAYAAADFHAAIETFKQLADRFGRISLIDLYLDACREHLKQQTTADQHNGAITLTQK